MNANSKAQLSLEFLILFSALTVFLLAFLPIYSQAQQNAKAAIVAETQALAFSQITGLARQAETLGLQNSLSEKTRFQADATSFSFEDSTSTLSMEYSYAGKAKTLSEKIGFPLSAPQGDFKKGYFLVEAENTGVVGIRISPADQE